MNQSQGAQGVAQGTSFGPYVLVRQLGAGAFGAVYEARKAPLNKRVALKILHRDKALNPDMIARFLQEARAAAGLNHPHIAAVDDLGVVDEVPYIAMEFLDGEPLTAMINREAPLDPVRTLDVMFPVLSAVATVHESGIVHRDLKPDNIFLARGLAGRANPKVLDFGIAKVTEGEGAGATQTGFIMGTPEYMAIEQWGGSRHATPLSDQWALGVILFQCLSGRRPFEGEGVMALAMRISSGPPSPLSTYVRTLPPGLEAIVLRTMERLPAQRFPSTRALGAALLPYASPSARELWAPEFLRAGEVPAVSSTVAMPTPPIAPQFVSPPPAPDTFAHSSGTKDSPPPAPTSRSIAWIAGALGLTLLAGTALVVRPLLSASSDTSTTPRETATQPDTTPAPPPPAPAAPPPSPAPEAQTVNAQTEAPPPAAPEVESPPADPVQHIETDRERRARERAEREAAAQTSAPEPAPATPSDSLTPMQRAQACRSSTDNEPDRNNCIINALRGHASSMQELGMLGATQMTAGHSAEAVRTMRSYIQRYPQGPMAPTFGRYIETHQ